MILGSKVEFKTVAYAWLGGFIAISIIAGLAEITGQLFIMGSFGASCILLFGFPKSPFSQPRNIIAGHFLSTLIGLLCLFYLGDAWWSMAFALATALAIMLLTNTVHPPAGSNPLIIFLAASSMEWSFLFLPCLIGSIALVIVGLFYNNTIDKKSYPIYW